MHTIVNKPVKFDPLIDGTSDAFGAAYLIQIKLFDMVTNAVGYTSCAKNAALYMRSPNCIVISMPRDMAVQLANMPFADFHAIFNLSRA